MPRPVRSGLKRMAADWVRPAWPSHGQPQTSEKEGKRRRRESSRRAGISGTLERGIPGVRQRRIGPFPGSCFRRL